MKTATHDFESVFSGGVRNIFDHTVLSPLLKNCDDGIRAA